MDGKKWKKSSGVIRSGQKWSKVVRIVGKGQEQL